MILRALIAALAIWGMTWSKDASAVLDDGAEQCSYGSTSVGDMTLPQLTCWYVHGYGGGGGYFNPDPGLGGGGGGGYSGGNQNSAWSMLSAIEHQADHLDSATCNADVLARHASANVDVRAENTRLLQEDPWDPYPLRVDDLIKVTYSDGGSEVWRVTSSVLTEMISPIPEPGSHQCP